MIEQFASSNQIAEICVVGAGPVGISLALELERLGKSVLLLESGGERQQPSEASHAEIADLARHAPMELATCRALGGASWTWGGRCVPYDAIDWMPRPFVTDALWPVSEAEMRPWYRPASEYLLCGDDTFSLPYPRPLCDGLTADALERWSREPKVILEHRDRLRRSSLIRVSLHCTVTGIELSSDCQRIENLRVHTPQGERTVRARHYVLAMGGVETTRLLLHAQQRYRDHFGGVDGPLGRYYMGHISGKIANIVLNNPAEIRALDFVLDGNGAYYRRRFMLSAAIQLRHQLLNTAFWPDNPAFHDPSHGSGVLSAVFLALAFPPTGRRLLSEAIRQVHVGPRPHRLAAHLRNALLGAPSGAVDIYRILRDRFLNKPRKPGFLVRNRGGKYALHYHAEQAPNPHSRIRLSTSADAFGVPRAAIDLRFTEQDVQSVIDSHRLLDISLQQNGIGRLQPIYAPDDEREVVYAQATDGFHQVGTTRMGVDPRQSVVDADLRVHGLENLYIASSSVFPTTGQANSTFLAVAFALRLAEHLHRQSALKI